MRRLLLALPLLLCLPATSYAQSGCTGQSASGTLCGNNTSSQGPPALRSATSIFDKAFGATQGLMLNRGASTWNGTATPSLGLNGGTGGAVILNGSSTGAVTVQVPAAAGTTTFQLPGTNGTNGQVLSTNGSGTTTWTTVSGTGTVTSVGLALPNIFTVSGSPVTAAGTLTGTLATQNANLVWSGPTTGAAATPSFRSLVGADLPNPSTSSLGGVQAINAVTSNWITSINTSGVPQLSQPAFSDISGSITPAQCPNPSASTLGCVESYVAVASQWIRSISTSGVPSSSQPMFSDISGSISLAQLPSLSDKTVLGNNSGGTAVPSALAATNVLDMIATTQGDILYRNGTTWVALAPGTSGQVLSSGGAAANPSWATVTGTGTVTSIATNNGLTGGTITTTGTLGLATIATGNVLAYTGAGSGVPVATTPSAVLDVIGSTTGNILYRSAGGGGWIVLAPGTNGQVLTMGASTPSWTNAGSVSNVVISPGGSITATGTCNITTSGTCTVALSTTPNIGAATGTSLALGGASLGSNALAITGTSQFGGNIGVGTPSLAAFNVNIASNFDGTPNDAAALQVASSFSIPDSSTHTNIWGQFIAVDMLGGTARVCTECGSLRILDIFMNAGASMVTQEAIRIDRLTAATNNYAIVSALNVLPATTANWGNGTLTPTAPEHINRNAVTNLASFTGSLISATAQDGQNGAIAIQVYQNGGFKIPQFYTQLARGTGASPSAVGSGDFLFQLGGEGFGATAFNNQSDGGLVLAADENFSGTAKGTKVFLQAVKKTTTTNNTVLTVDGYGHTFAVAASGTLVASIGSCGTSPSAATGSDTDGQVTEGTTATGCTITFANAFASAPFCTVSTQAALSTFAYAVSNTAITITHGTASSTKLNWHCAGT